MKLKKGQKWVSKETNIVYTVISVGYMFSHLYPKGLEKELRKTPEAFISLGTLWVSGDEPSEWLKNKFKLLENE